VWTLELPPWLPPGQYELHVGLYTREGMERLPLPDGSTTHAVATVDVAALAPPAAGPPAAPFQTSLPLAQGLTLHGHTPIPEHAAAGQNLDVTLFWQAESVMSRPYELQFHLVAETQPAPGESWTRALIDGRYPNTVWPPGTVVADWHPLSLSADLAPGRYTLHVTVLDDGAPAGQTAHLATVEVSAGE
jgi:hypothetical protein